MTQGRFSAPFNGFKIACFAISINGLSENVGAVIFWNDLRQDRVVHMPGSSLVSPTLTVWQCGPSFMLGLLSDRFPLQLNRKQSGSYI